MPGKTVEDRLRQQLGTFCANSGNPEVSLSPDTDFIKDMGFTSLQGLEFVLELCDEFNFDFPSDFNPFVDDEGRRGRTFKELTQVIETQIANQGDSHGEK